jgi:hypothetical protein
VVLNARSMCNKLCELHYLLYNDSYDIVLVTESWLNSRHPDGLIDPNSKYNILRCDRQSSVGGGVCVFISKSYIVTEVDTRELYPHLELCCFDVDYRDTSIRFFCVYRSPSDNNCMVDLVDCLTRFSVTKGPCIITGNLNCGDINWSQLTAPNDSVQDKLLTFSMLNGFTQLVTEPSRLHNILDVVFL